jgi:hypothetical protein
MRRHGWAFCLGAILAGAAAAQPPADEERYPPAPDLPGVVVGQLPPPRTVDGPKEAPKDAPKAEPKAMPKDARPAVPAPDVTLVPNGSTPATPVIPVEPVPAPAAAGMFPPPAGCCPTARSGCHIGLTDIREWFCFHSKARQTSHYVTPYRPPLYAWFLCDKPTAPGAGPAFAGTITKSAIAPAPLTAGIADDESVPTGEEVPAPLLGGGVPIGKCLDAEVLTNFQPVNPGLLFTPGAAPTANPTSQVKPSSFRPK